MLLRFAESFRDALAAVLSAEEARAAIENLALAYREGKHVVSGPLPVLRALAQADVLSDGARAAFRQMKQKHPEQHALCRELRCRVEIEPDAPGIQREERIGGDKLFRVPLTYFADSGRAQAARFIAEDRDDAQVYRYAARGFVFRHAGRRGIQVQLQPYGGGGSSIADALRDHAPQGLTVAIVDGDASWEDEQPSKSAQPREASRRTGSGGETARKAWEAAEELAPKAICDLHILACHEIENLLPSQLVLDCLSAEDRDLRERCLKLADLGLLGAGPPLDRLDLKQGLRGHDLARAPLGHPKRHFLAGVFTAYRERVSAPPEGWCDEASGCEQRERSDCRCTLFAGMGSGMLARVARRFEETSPQKVAEYLFSDGATHEPAWSEIGRLLFSWGCSYRRMRV